LSLPNPLCVNHDLVSQTARSSWERITDDTHYEPAHNTTARNAERARQKVYELRNELLGRTQETARKLQAEQKQHRRENLEFGAAVEYRILLRGRPTGRWIQAVVVGTNESTYDLQTGAGEITDGIAKQQVRRSTDALLRLRRAPPSRHSRLARKQPASYSSKDNSQLPPVTPGREYSQPAGSLTARAAELSCQMDLELKPMRGIASLSSIAQTARLERQSSMLETPMPPSEAQRSGACGLTKILNSRRFGGRWLRNSRKCDRKKPEAPKRRVVARVVQARNSKSISHHRASATTVAAVADKAVDVEHKRRKELLLKIYTDSEINVYTANPVNTADPAAQLNVTLATANPFATLGAVQEEPSMIHTKTTESGMVGKLVRTLSSPRMEVGLHITNALAPWEETRFEAEGEGAKDYSEGWTY